MVMPKKMFSVVVPAYNSEKYILKSLESVANQTHLPYEIIIIDDGSSDHTVDIARKFLEKNNRLFASAKLIEQENRGSGAARNAGIKAAQCEWISFLDSDDCWEKRKLESVEKIITDNSDIDAVAHDMTVLDEAGKIIRQTNYSKVYNSSRNLFVQLYRTNFLITSCMTIKRDVLVKVEGFDTSLLNAQDYDLWLKAAKFVKLYYINKPFTLYVNRGGSLTSNVYRRYCCEKNIYWKYYQELTDITGYTIAKKVLIKRIIRVHISEIRLALQLQQYKAASKILFCIIAELRKGLAGFYK